MKYYVCYKTLSVDIIWRNAKFYLKTININVIDFKKDLQIANGQKIHNNIIFYQNNLKSKFSNNHLIYGSDFCYK